MLRERYGRGACGSSSLAAPDRHSEIGREDIEKAVGSTVVHTLPSNYRMALQAANKGRPLALDNHNAPFCVIQEVRASGLAGLHPARNKAGSVAAVRATDASAVLIGGYTCGHGYDDEFRIR